MKRTAVTANTHALLGEMLRNSGDTKSTSPAKNRKDIARLHYRARLAMTHPSLLRTTASMLGAGGAPTCPRLSSRWRGHALATVFHFKLHESL
jgi:hypothetical protein